MKRSSLKALATVIAGVTLFAGARSLLAQTAPVGNSVVASVHNLNNVYGANTIKNDYGANQVCLPCHAPHQLPAQNVAENLTRLWNHTLNPASSYTLYGSGTSYLSTIDEVSRKCLGCHDGTIAVDSYGSSPNATMTGTMQSDLLGKGTAGFVVGAGGNLTHDHPIDVLYNSSGNFGGVTSALGTNGKYTYASPWTGRNNDPSTFTINGYTSSKWGTTNAYTVTALSAVSFYTPTGSTQSLKSVTDANSASGTTSNGGTVAAGVANGDGTYTHTVTVGSKYVYCRSCHDPHNNLYHFMRVPNDNSQLCLTCHNK
jgi:predicted CXXCH cytochrome family protein